MIRRNTVLPAGLLGLQQGRQRDVILGHHPVQHVLVSIGVLDSQLVKLDKLLLKYKPHIYVIFVGLI